MGLFVNDTLYSSENRFALRYDKVKVNAIYAALKYDQLDKLSVSLSGNFYHYQSTNELYAWQKPNMTMDLSIDYNLSNKFLVGLSFYYVGKRKAASLLPVAGISPNEGIYVVDLKSYVDANLKFEYRYTQRLSGFVEINNLFSSKYDTWYLYQVQPFFALLGASYSF
jgi:outer membrane receptor protein involved in Fe transport